ncbi:hypothetical protein [Candidatus Erwinia haradaeae]|nr:hypothetical protein [Candidatus Erwinia haradaeae]
MYREVQYPVAHLLLAKSVIPRLRCITIARSRYGPGVSEAHANFSLFYG